MTGSGFGHVGQASGRPTICVGIVSTACFRKAVNIVKSTPNDHFTAGPDCRGILSGRGRVDQAGGSPTIRAGIVSSAGAGVIISVADDHFTAAPHCGVRDSGRGRVGGAGGCPTICAGIVSSTGATPDNHFATGPDCSSPPRGISGGRSRPLVCARSITTRLGNFGKSVDNLP